jgi:hypothetical protein
MLLLLLPLGAAHDVKQQNWTVPAVSSCELGPSYCSASTQPILSTILAVSALWLGSLHEPVTHTVFLPSLSSGNLVPHWAVLPGREISLAWRKQIAGSVYCSWIAERGELLIRSIVEHALLHSQMSVSHFSKAFFTCQTSHGQRSFICITNFPTSSFTKLKSISGRFCDRLLCWFFSQIGPNILKIWAKFS